MPVVSQGQMISSTFERALLDVNKKITSINEKLDKFNLPQTEYTVSSKGITLHSKGKMVWWTKSKNAVCYRLKLFIQDDEIDVIEIERNKAYHTFIDLYQDLSYRVVLEVEDRNGEIINKLSINV